MIIESARVPDSHTLRGASTHTLSAMAVRRKEKNPSAAHFTRNESIDRKWKRKIIAKCLRIYKAKRTNRRSKWLKGWQRKKCYFSLLYHLPILGDGTKGKIIEVVSRKKWSINIRSKFEKCKKVRARERERINRFSIRGQNKSVRQ